MNRVSVYSATHRGPDSMHSEKKQSYGHTQGDFLKWELNEWYAQGQGWWSSMRALDDVNNFIQSKVFYNTTCHKRS